MKQIILDGHIVTKVNENAEEPVTIGIGVSDETDISVGQILEDDLTVREITEQEIIERFGLFTFVNKNQLYNSLTQAELISFLSASKTTASIEVIKEILDAQGSVDLNTNSALVDENIITIQRKEDVLGITEKKEFLATGMVITKPPVEFVGYEEEETTTTTEAPE